MESLCSVSTSLVQPSSLIFFVCFNFSFVAEELFIASFSKPWLVTISLYLRLLTVSMCSWLVVGVSLFLLSTPVLHFEVIILLFWSGLEFLLLFSIDKGLNPAWMFYHEVLWPELMQFLHLIALFLKGKKEKIINWADFLKSAHFSNCVKW